MEIVTQLEANVFLLKIQLGLFKFELLFLL